MDVILSGPQGGGKTQTVRSLTELYKTRTHQHNAIILELEGGTPIVEDPLVDGFVEVKPDIVIFDGCITGAKDLAAAVSAVRRYRETGREVMAIYAVQSEVVNLSEAIIPHEKSSTVGRVLEDITHQIRTLEAECRVCGPVGANRRRDKIATLSEVRFKLVDIAPTGFIPAERSLSDYPDGTIAKGYSGEKWVKIAGYWSDEHGARYGNLPSTWDGLVKLP